MHGQQNIKKKKNQLYVVNFVQHLNVVFEVCTIFCIVYFVLLYFNAFV